MLALDVCCSLPIYICVHPSTSSTTSQCPCWCLIERRPLLLLLLSSQTARQRYTLQLQKGDLAMPCQPQWARGQDKKHAGQHTRLLAAKTIPVGRKKIKQNEKIKMEIKRETGRHTAKMKKNEAHQKATQQHATQATQQIDDAACNHDIGGQQPCWVSNDPDAGVLVVFFFFWCPPADEEKKKAQAHHTSTYFHTRRVPI